MRTGKLVWTFHTVPHPGEFGYETWPKDAWKTQGGVHNWNEMSVDEKRGIIYIPLGTARYDFYGADRHGQDLFGNSLVALDARTGKRLWHFQMVHHDLWDYDLPTAPKLLTVKHNGKNVDVVAQPTKFGFLYVFDSVTGEPLWPIEERPVPQSDVAGEWSSPTQPFPTKPPPFARQSFTEKDINPYLSDEDKAKVRMTLQTYRNEGLFTPPSLRGTIEMPGNNGGANWGSSGVNPSKGMIYIVSKELPMTIKLQLPGAGRGGGGGRGRGGPGRGGDGAPIAPAPAPPPPPPAPVDTSFIHYTAPYDFMQQASSGLSPITPPWSQLTAVDLNSGTIKWQVPDGTVPSIGEQANARADEKMTGSFFPRGGVLVTGGGLVFVATSTDRKLRAYDEENGKVVWETSLTAAAEGVPASYEIAGRQYIALCVGGGNGDLARGPAPRNGSRASRPVHGLRSAEEVKPKNPGQKPGTVHSIHCFLRRFRQPPPHSSIEMSRIARVAVPDVPYHITQRGNGRRVIFYTDADRRAYLDRSGATPTKYRVIVWAYCLMSNHVHLVAAPERPDSFCHAL